MFDLSGETTVLGMNAGKGGPEDYPGPPDYDTRWREIT
jgi:hypothetical protein